MPTKQTKVQKFQETFWNGKAKENARYHILSEDAILDPNTADEAFESAGIRDGRRLGPFVDPEACVVDLGCGIGRVMKRLAPHVREIIGYDISREMISRGRDYLRGVENARFVPARSAGFPELEDESIDFFYSLLCLIHVDKRSAWRYLKDVARILAPGGRAHLQVHDILSPDGLAKFIAEVERDYPLEFYAPEEIVAFVESVGLSVQRVTRYAEFIDVVALKGDPEVWRADLARDVAIERHAREGVFAGGRVASDVGGSAEMRIRNRGEDWRGFTAVCRIHGVDDALRETAEFVHSEGVVWVPPATATTLTLTRGGGGDIALAVDGGRLGFETTRSSPLAPGPAAIQIALIPSGLEWNDATAALVPGSSTTILLDVA